MAECLGFSMWQNVWASVSGRMFGLQYVAECLGFSKWQNVWASVSGRMFGLQYVAECLGFSKWHFPKLVVGCFFFPPGSPASSAVSAYELQQNIIAILALSREIAELSLHIL